MFDPSYIVLNSKYAFITMHSDRDVMRKYVPKTQWMNPFRYSVAIFPKSHNQKARMTQVNKDGMAHIKISNFVYDIKVKLGLREPFRSSKRNN